MATETEQTTDDLSMTGFGRSGASIGAPAAGQSPSDVSTNDAVVEISNPSGAADIVLVCEHASNHIPADLNNLGLADEAIGSHAAWDLGALAVARRVSSRLDAPLIASRVSRLVYDCNRPLDAETAIPAKSEIYDVPGNIGLREPERRARAERVYEPFRSALAGCIEGRVAARRSPILITIHSFTPVYLGVRRQVEIGIVHDTDTRLADALLLTIDDDREAGFVVGRNTPYGPEDGVTHTLATHGVSRGLLNVMFEVRNDLIDEPSRQVAVADWLAGCIADALARQEDVADSGAAGLGLAT